MHSAAWLASVLGSHLTRCACACSSGGRRWVGWCAEWVRCGRTRVSPTARVHTACRRECVFVFAACAAVGPAKHISGLATCPPAADTHSTLLNALPLLLLLPCFLSSHHIRPSTRPPSRQATSTAAILRASGAKAGVRDLFRGMSYPLVTVALQVC